MVPPERVRKRDESDLGEGVERVRLKALPAPEARTLGLHLISVRTLLRWAVNSRRFGIAGCIDGQLIHQFVRERFGPDVPIPSYATLRWVWLEWFGSGGARQKYVRSAARLKPSGQHIVVHRPGHRADGAEDCNPSAPKESRNEVVPRLGDEDRTRTEFTALAVTADQSPAKR
ncbi:hypothetical protein ACGF0J_22420 [Nonomuraea sp. NPDC047897]|uniref:hypothetical protein n=1 Tax=Nonomuraea sp. NPDC047897 TaxID=3364346 RepID=UPI00371379B0